MTFSLAIVLALLGIAIVMFAINKPRMDVVALMVLTALPFTGAVTMNEALAGFSDANIVLIATLFVIGDGLVRTGVASLLGDWLITKAGANESRLLVLLMLVVCGLGSIMSSTAVTAIFIPVAIRISQSTGAAPSRLMMPISFAALISGMMTLVATAPNLVVNSEMVRQGATGFHFFSFTPFGVPILMLGLVYMMFARRMLTGSKLGTSEVSRRPSLADWVMQYKLAGREFRVGVTAQSPLAGKTLEEIRMRDVSGASLVAIERDRKLIQPSASTTVLPGDILFVDLIAPDVNVESLLKQYCLELMPLSGAYFTDRSQEIGMAEVILPADSEFVGKTVVQARFRDKVGLTVIGLRRGQEAHERGLQNETLRLGDTLLLIGPWKAIERIEPDQSGLVILRLPVEIDHVLPVSGRAPHALACLALVVVLMVTGVVPNVQAALIGCLLMGALGCITITSAYRSIDWKTLVLIVGMLPFSIALQKTGGVELGANALMSVTGGMGPHGVLACVFFVTAVLGLFISNTATAVLMAPVALAIARDLGYSPYPFAMTVALAASTAFVTPVSSPVNTLVVAPGNYSFGDFVKVGAPFAVVVMVVSVFLVPVFLPFFP